MRMVLECSVSRLSAWPVSLAPVCYRSGNVARRIKRFLDPASGDTFQVDTAVEGSFSCAAAGSVAGRREGKRSSGILPDSHADFVFAHVAAAEEFGIMLCLISSRAVPLSSCCARCCTRDAQRRPVHALCDRKVSSDPVRRAIGHQHYGGVNLAMMPTKGMTLPFISYGGSSMLLLLATGMGMSLLTRLCDRPSSEGLAVPKNSALAGRPRPDG